MKHLPCAAFACLAALFLAACANEPMSPSATYSTGPVYQPGAGAVFRERDFAWSRAPGTGSIQGVVRYHSGQMNYSCAGRDVILTPDNPWVERRMFILYGSTSGAAAPADIVRARTPATSDGDYASYARKTVCDSDERFSFTGLPAGYWYVITLARPEDGSTGAMAIMRRVVTNGGVTALAMR